VKGAPSPAHGGPRELWLEALCLIGESAGVGWRRAQRGELAEQGKCTLLRPVIFWHTR